MYGSYVWAMLLMILRVHYKFMVVWQDRDRFCAFLATNVASMLAHDKTTDGLFGGLWQGPVASAGAKNFTNSTDSTTQTSALDLLLARCA